MINSIVPNILFDDLYDSSKYKSLINHCFFINILQNSEEPGSLEEKFSDRYLVKSIINTDFMNQIDLSTKLDKIHKQNEFFSGDFEKGFLNLAIKNIPKYYEYCIKKVIREKGIYSKMAKVDFYKSECDRLLCAIDELQEASHLNNHTIDLAVHEAYNCIDLVNRLRNENEAKYETIQFNLSKVELLTLFLKLHEAGLIIGLSSAELFARMEKYFTYKGDKAMIKLYDAYHEYKSKRKNTDKAMNSLVIKLSKALDI